MSVAPSKIKSPITPFGPREMTPWDIKRTITDYASSAKLAQAAGYDGVEIMGSEGYLINQFIVKHTNKRTDEWGGSFENRIKLPIEIVQKVREAVGKNFIIIYRLSMIDLIEDGSNWDEVVKLAKEIEKAGATIINTGIGWHEARIPTIATMVPHAAFAWVTRKLKNEIKIPLCTSNRINSPDVAEKVLSDGNADMVSMARPMLADPHFVRKAAQGKAEEINTCIACNQACLDHTFSNKTASCLVNPQACNETEFDYIPTTKPKKLAVVGSGPAGMAFAALAAQRGHQVTLYEKEAVIGGQFNMAKIIPGKEDYKETIRYYGGQIQLNGVNLILNKKAEINDLLDYDEVILATGVLPRQITIAGANHPKVVSYIDILTETKTAGKRVAVIGAGGIGFDICEFLAHKNPHHQQSVQEFLKEWGIDPSNEVRGGIEGVAPQIEPSPREIVMFQRTEGKLGARLGKTTGWIHRANLKKKKVHMVAGIEYLRIDDEGLHYRDHNHQIKVYPCDTVVVCAGQISYRDLAEPLKKINKPFHLIGGADVAKELDAKRAIDQAARLASII